MYLSSKHDACQPLSSQIEPIANEMAVDDGEQDAYESCLKVDVVVLTHDVVLMWLLHLKRHETLCLKYQYCVHSLFSAPGGETTSLSLGTRPS